MRAFAISDIVIADRPLGAQEVATVREAEAVTFSLLQFDADDAIDAPRSQDDAQPLSAGRVGE